jgi:lysophospholipase L1-like esterase
LLSGTERVRLHWNPSPQTSAAHSSDENQAQLIAVWGRRVNERFIRESLALKIRWLFLTLLLVVPATAQATPLTLAGFGDSITCDACNDGSYLRYIGSYLSEAPIIDDNGESAERTSEVAARLDTWITDGNTADFVIILSGTPDTYQALGGWHNQAYDEAETVGNISDMLDAVFDAGMQAILVAPLPVWTPTPCGGPGLLTCEIIDASLASLATALAGLATTAGVPFVDIYDAFTNDPDFGEAPGSADSLFGSDGLHPRDNGDDLIAFEIAGAINAVPEPSTGLLVASGLLLIAMQRRQQRG